MVQKSDLWKRVMRCFCFIILMIMVCQSGYASSWRENWFSGVIKWAARADMVTLERENIVDDIFHMRAVLKVGPNTYDRIGIHRVVRERSPWRPIRTKRAIMLVHGSANTFNSFLPYGEPLPPDHGLAVYLAQQNVDVWGIDLRWTLVPSEEDNLTFMKEWNIQSQLDDITLSLQVARMVRGITQGHFSKLHLLGFSMGSILSYALAGEETTRPVWQRNIKTLIPIDASLVYDPNDEVYKNAACARYQMAKAAYDAGIYYNDQGQVFKGMGLLAVLYPDEPSPVIDDMTNEQVMLLIATATHMMFSPPEGSYTPFYHYAAGIFDEVAGMPVGLQYTDFDYALNYMTSIPDYETLLNIIETDGMACGAENVPYADHLNDIEIPVFYIGSAGSEGYYGEYNMSLLSSTDKKYLNVGFLPPEYAAFDFAHMDLLFADQAKEWVWKPIYDWIASH